MDTKLELTPVQEIPSEKIDIYLWMTFGICFLGNILGGTISTLMSVYLPVVVKSLLGDVSAERLSYVSAYISALYLVGWAVGGFTWGMVSDKIGRARAMVLCISCYGVFTWLIHFAATWEQVVILRLISGFGVGGVLVISATFLSEVWPQRSRSIIIGIVSIGFPIGVFSAGLTNYIVSDWRQAFLIGLLPFSLAVFSIWLLKESHQWQNAKESGAQEKFIFSVEHRSNLVKGVVIFGTMLIGLWAIFSWLPTWVQSLLTNSDGQRERGLTMMLLGAGGLTGGFFSGWVSNALGVRRAMMLCFMGCIIMSLLLFKFNTSFSAIVYVETAALALFFGISQGLLSIYIPQLFPVHIRATATGICFNVGRLVTATAVFFVGALVTALGGYGNTIMTFSMVFVIGFVTLYFTAKIGSTITENKMAYIKVPEGVPGIRSLVMFRPDTGKHLYDLAHVLLREPSPLTPAERELIATYVSSRNNCNFCMNSHAAAARELFGNERHIVDCVIDNINEAPLTPKMKALLNIAGKVQQSGKSVTEEDINAAREQQATHREIHDTVLIAAAFSMFNRYVDGLASLTPTDPRAYEEMGKRMTSVGYVLPKPS